jgi:hypothetical protein
MPEIALFEGLVEVFNRDGTDAMLELATPEVTIATAQGFPGGGRFEGKEQAGNFLKEFVDAWDEVRYDIEAARLVNGCVVHSARWVVRGKASQVEAELHFHGVTRFRDGLLEAVELFWTENEAIEHARGAG